MTLKMWLKLTIARIGWSLFIWANDTTEDKYWKQIYEIERKRELSEQESNCNLPDVSNLVCPTHGTMLYKHTNGLAYCSLCTYSVSWQTGC